MRLNSVFTFGLLKKPLPHGSGSEMHVFAEVYITNKGSNRSATPDPNNVAKRIALMKQFSDRTNIIP
jgi:hypothetical protein